MKDDICNCERKFCSKCYPWFCYQCKGVYSVYYRPKHIRSSKHRKKKVFRDLKVSNNQSKYSCYC